jgi:phosphate transport system substrate-binding protein
MPWFVVPASAGIRRNARSAPVLRKNGLPAAARAAWFAITSWFVAGWADAAELRVVGTDLLGLEFTKAFYEFSVRHGLELALTFDGSRPGLEQLKAGRADFGLFVLPPEDRPVPGDFETHPVGYHAVVIVAPASCPLDEITFDQLAVVFGAGEGGANSSGARWSDLGVGGDWAGEFVNALAPEVGTGIAVEYFRHKVLRDGALKRELPRFANEADLSTRFSGPPQPRVLAITAGLPPHTKMMKALKLAVGAGQPAVLATAETLHAGTYPLRLPVQFVFRVERRAEALRVAEFLFSDDAAQLLTAADVVPLPPTDRADQLRDVRPKEKSAN